MFWSKTVLQQKASIGQDGVLQLGRLKLSESDIISYKDGTNQEVFLVDQFGVVDCTAIRTGASTTSPLVFEVATDGVVRCKGISMDGSTGILVKNTAATTTASITQAGAISGTSCQIGGNAVLTTTYNPFFSCGKINANGTKAYSSGRVDFTVSRIGAGNYHATYTSSVPQF